MNGAVSYRRSRFSRATKEVSRKLGKAYLASFDMSGRPVLFETKTSFRRLCGLTVCCCLAAFGNQTQVPEQTVADHFRAGQRAAAAQQFERAIAEFRTVLKLDPTLVEARANLGLMYYSAGDFRAAVSELAKVSVRAPDLLPGQLFLGLSYLKLGSAREAVPPLLKALRLDPGNVEAQRGLLSCYLNLAQYQDAVEVLNRLEAVPAQEETLYAIGQAYLEMGRGHTVRMAHQYASSVWAHRLAGDLAADRGDKAAAEESYRRASAMEVQMPDMSCTSGSLENAKNA